MLTRKEFEELRLEEAEALFANKKLQKDALSVLTEADKNHWIHQTNWFGEPVLQLPQDMFAIQEIVPDPTRQDHGRDFPASDAPPPRLQSKPKGSEQLLRP